MKKKIINYCMVLSIIVAVSFSAGLFMSEVAEARDFTVASWGGTFQDAQRECYFDPFAKKVGIKVLEDTYLGGWGQFKTMQETKHIPWDVVQVESSELIRGCEEGLFLPLDYSKIKKDGLVEGAPSECGVGALVVSHVVAYNAKLLKEYPTSTADFFNLKKWPGKRGLRKGPKFNLEFALMADGVDPKDVFKILSTKAGVDRAFKKLDTIKSQVQWWEGGAQAPEWLASGDVVMSFAYNGRISIARKEGKDLRMIWDKNIYTMDSWAILKDSPYTDQAHELINFTINPEQQAKFSKIIPYGPSNHKAVNYFTKELADTLPAGKNVATGLFFGEEPTTWWVDNLVEITERWNAWVSKN